MIDLLLFILCVVGLITVIVLLALFLVLIVISGIAAIKNSIEDM